MTFKATGSNHKGGISHYRKARPNICKAFRKAKRKSLSFWEYLKHEWKLAGERTERWLR